MTVITFVPPKKREIRKVFNYTQYPEYLRHKLATGKITKEEFNKKLANYARRD
jgi:uncharacterized membrane protein